MFDRWDLILLGIAAYVAVTSLVRLMIGRRDELTKKFRDEFEAEQIRKVEAEAAARREEMRRKQREAQENAA